MIDLGLSRVARLVQHSPPSWTAIHVAGTNGKGTICANLTAMLRVKGVRTGRFTSPHLIDRWDCVAIDGRPVSESVFRDAERRVAARNHAAAIHATEFELLTATAFEVFEREKIAMGIIEVGMGGRLDATNVLENKIMTIISKIGLDHQAFLGDTIEEIALQKAGIMRRGVPCVVDRTNPPTVRRAIEEHAKDVGTHITLSSLEPEIEDDLYSAGWEQHQVDNLACAHRAFELAFPSRPTLRELIPAIHAETWPGRLQTTSITALTGRPEPVLLDGAHNPQSAAALGSYVTRMLRPKGPVTWVLAASAGRELSEVMSHLLAPGDAVIATRFGPVDGMPWVEAMTTESILAAAAAAAAGIPTSRLSQAGSSVGESLQAASAIAAGGPLVIAGSLYLVSDVLRALRAVDEGRRVSPSA